MALYLVDSSDIRMINTTNRQMTTMSTKRMDIDVLVSHYLSTYLPDDLGISRSFLSLFANMNLFRVLSDTPVLSSPTNHT